ncbi:MAG: hemolysin family protein [Acidimicrobiia bacterium]
MTTAALLVAAALVVVAGILRAAGASLVRTPRADALQDAADGDRRAAKVADLLVSRTTLQPALGLVHTGLMVVAAISATWGLSRSTTGWGLMVELVLLSLLLLAVSEILPRGYGRGHPRLLAYRWVFLLGPAVTFGRAASDLISDDNGDDHEPNGDEDEDDDTERELISSVIEVGDTVVREVMVPRPDMVTLPSTATVDEAIALSIEAGRSRIPVLGAGIDDVIGVLYVRDLLVLFDDDGGGRRVDDLVRPVFIVPEAMPVLDLMREMQSDRDHLAIVVDEFGGTAGLVTMEDLLEEIVGEISDEYDEEEPLITELGSGEYLMDGRVSIDELEDLIGIEVPDEDWDTVGGLLLGLAGRVPEEGESFTFEEHVFTAEQVQGRRIAQVRLRPR